MERIGVYSDGCRRLRELLPPQAITEERLGQAMDFLDDVRARLHGKPGNYRTFCRVLENLTGSPIRLIDGGHDLPPLRPEDLLWIVRKILEGQEDLIEKFNSYLPVNPMVSVIKPAAAEAMAVRPAMEEKAQPRELPSAAAAAAMEDSAGIKTLSACQGTQPASGVDKLFDQVSRVRNTEDILHRFLPAVAGAEPPESATPLFPCAGGLARREEGTCNRKENNDETRKAAPVVSEVDEKVKEKFTSEKSRCLGWIQRSQRKASSSSEIYQQVLPNLYRLSFDKPRSVPDVTKECSRVPRPEMEKRKRPDESEQKCSSRMRRISVTTPEKEKFKAAMPQHPQTVQKPDFNRRRLDNAQVVEEDVDELKECLLSAACYIDERMNGTNEDDREDGEIRGGKGRIHFLRCVEAMYSDRGREMVEMIEAEPEKLLHMVRRRLHQKIGEVEIASEKQEVYPMATR
ncbi:unnamed protein product [Linum trigynum]